MSWVEIIADRKIRDAQEEGKFDNLQGAGEPLNLEFNPNVPPDQRMAQRLMKEANMLPDWIEAEKEIRQLRTRWDERLERFRQRRAELLQPGFRSESSTFERVDQHRDAFLFQAAKDLVELNRRIERFNLIVPVMSRQQMRLKLRERMQQLDAEFPRLQVSRIGKGESPSWESALPSETGQVRLDNRMPMRRRRETFG